MAMKNHMNTTQLHSYTVRGAFKIKYWKKLRLLTEQGGRGYTLLCEKIYVKSSPIWLKRKGGGG